MVMSSILLTSGSERAIRPGLSRFCEHKASEITERFDGEHKTANVRVRGLCLDQIWLQFIVLSLIEVTQDSYDYVWGLANHGNV